MEIGVVVEHAQRVAAVRGDSAPPAADVEEALRSVGKLHAWLTSARTALTRQLAEHASFPEQAAAECTRDSTRDAMRDQERADTLAQAPQLADALDDGDVTAGHVDALTRATRTLDDDDQRRELFDRAEGLVDIASVATLDQWRRRLDMEAKRIRRNDGIDRLQRQRRDCRVRTWVDDDGMWRLDGRFDPVTGARLAARLDAATQALFAQETPDTCPTDPIEKQRHLRALALARTICDDGAIGSRPGRPEFVVVIDTATPDGAGGPTVDWGIPVEVPHRVLAELMDEGSVQPVVVHNGVVLHAPGNLDLGRTTRLASPAQRRALRALYSTCAIPGCTVRYDRCRLHHVIWWRHGGRTDLDNLLPVCTHHHTRIHDDNWIITLGPDRALRMDLPDGTTMTTGPPQRRAA